MDILDSKSHKNIPVSLPMIDITSQVPYFAIFCLTFTKSGTYIDFKGPQRPKKHEVAIIPIVCGT
jgi:hypothetical protein